MPTANDLFAHSERSESASVTELFGRYTTFLTSNS